MKGCLIKQTLLVILTQASAFISPVKKISNDHHHIHFSLPKKIEVCGFKDCKRSGGGTKLEKMIAGVLEEKNLSDVIEVEGCDCQGECGYGPNILVDGVIKNNIKTSEAILQALGIQN